MHYGNIFLNWMVQLTPVEDFQLDFRVFTVNEWCHSTTRPGCALKRASSSCDSWVKASAS